MLVRKFTDEELASILELADVYPTDPSWRKKADLLLYIAGRYISQKSTEERGPVKLRKKAALRLLKSLGCGRNPLRQIEGSGLLEEVGFVLLEQTLVRTSENESVAATRLNTICMAAYAAGRLPGTELIPEAPLRAVVAAVWSIVEHDRVPRVRENGALTITVRRLMAAWKILGNEPPTGARHSNNNDPTPTAFTRFATAFFDLVDGPAPTAEESLTRLGKITNAVGNWSPGAQASRTAQRKERAPSIMRQ